MATPSELFAKMASQFNPEQAEGLNAVVQFNLSGDNGGNWFVTVADGQCDVGEGQAEEPTATVSMDGSDYVDMISGKLSPVTAFMGGKVKVDGDLAAVMKLQTAFG